jgi:hypothetical protein
VVKNKCKMETQLKCINSKPLNGKSIAPPLKEGDIYTLKKIVNDSAGNPHYDVGLVSRYNYVSSIETGEELPNSQIGGVHWCHPSRFIEI